MLFPYFNKCEWNTGLFDAFGNIAIVACYLAKMFHMCWKITGHF